MTNPEPGRFGLTDADLEHRPAPDRDGPEVDRARDFAIEAARLLHDSHCEDIHLYDVRGLSEVTDFILIASGTSDRQIKSVAGHVNDLGKAHGFERFGSDRDEASTWLVLDYVDLMIHLFEPATRAHYDLEMMWGDAPRLDWQRP
ncbi:MAG: ribosome silencing factor [Phycisphaeraceae bacterium]